MIIRYKSEEEHPHHYHSKTMSEEKRDSVNSEPDNNENQFPQVKTEEKEHPKVYYRKQES